MGRPSLDVVYFSAVEWGHTWQRPQQIASRLARHGRVLYVEPMGLRAPRPSDLPRLIGRLGWRPPPIAATPGVTVHAAPPHLPLPGSPWASRANGRLLRRSVRRWLHRSGIASPIVWVGTPSLAVLHSLRGLPRRTLVYDCLDAFSAFHPEESGAIARAERILAADADVVLATSRVLEERMVALNPGTIRLPNAVDYEHFSSAARPLPAPARLAGLPRPLLGYVGEIARWLDVDAVRELALGHPDASVALIGPVRSPQARRELALPNVHLLGRVEYLELPRYLAQFDACLIPFRLDALTAATNPVKLYEYLATGKPIVTSPLPEVLPFRELVTVADPGGWSRALGVALEATGGATSAQRQRIARENTWDHRLERILASLEERAA